MIPDPVGFVARELGRRGALVEAGEGAVLALLPPVLAGELGLGEEARLSAVEEEGAVVCGLGTPLLESLVGQVREEVPVGAGRVQAPEPRASHARSLAERYVIRNGVAEVQEVLGGQGTYVVAWLAYVAEADERHEGLVRVVAHAGDGALPEPGFAELCEAGSEAALEPWHTVAVVPGVGPWLVRHARAEAWRALAPVEEATSRRHARDHERIAEYYGAMVAEARAPRRRVDAAAMEAKVAHLVAERDTKLRDLTERFALRVRLGLAAALWVAAPVVHVRLRVRRRKASRELVLRLPPGVHGFDRLPCEGCEGVTGQPAFCDERMHLLCETCVPVASGRPRCPACGG